MKIFFILLVTFLIGSSYYVSTLPSGKLAQPAAKHAVATKIETPRYSSKIANAQYPEIGWADLAPKGWDTAEEFKKFDFARYQDGDPKAEAELKRMQEAFNKAPVQKIMNGKKITISGYMVPLDVSTGDITDFLLVPFFGACIHVPPPPANQLIHVIPEKGLHLDVMAAITVQGVIETTYAETPMGSSGYMMNNPQVFPYVEKTCLFAPTCESDQK